MTTEDNLSAFFVSMYNKDNSVLVHISECIVSGYTMIDCYRKMIAENGMYPIGNLPEEYKIKLWEECKKTGIKSKNKLIDTAKILHTIKFINENS